MANNPIFSSQTTNANPANIDSDITGRVEHVVLTNKAYRYKSVEIPGGSLGCVLFSIVGNLPDKIDSSNFFIAFPKSNLKRYPIVNELVEISVDASKEAQNPKGSILSNYYYSDPLPLYNAVNHNAAPSSAKFREDALQSPTGKDFKEKQGLYPLQPLPGCTIIEGRFGNSLRLGSSNDAIPESPWLGGRGEPVTILRNGQKVQTAENVTSEFEDINGDGSVLGMFSSQTVSFVPACLNFDSYGQTVDTTQRGNYITTDPVKTTPVAAEPTVQQDVAKTATVKDAPTPVYETPATNTETITAQQELESLPNSEDEVTQIFEDEGVRHGKEPDPRWIYSVENTMVTSADLQSLDLNSVLFKAYLIHQQGLGGIRAIYNYASKGYATVPNPNPYSREYIYSNMFGKRVNSKSKNPVGNAGKDFERLFGTAYTPLNFLKYWAGKFIAKQKELSKNLKRNSMDYAILPVCKQLSVDTNFAKLICEIESSFDPNSASPEKDYQGLYQIGLSEFKKYYAEDDRYNPAKNARVGISLLKQHIESAKNLNIKL